ncbi:hypothetical protein [Georgenia sp. AZ-5]|uniref:hypothetical protein n=1 Tax=Georgenia sp. AZ-5 TaxID=3367526 RepID=UPI003754FAAF
MVRPFAASFLVLVRVFGRVLPLVLQLRSKGGAAPLIRFATSLRAVSKSPEWTSGVMAAVGLVLAAQVPALRVITVHEDR